MPTNYSRYLADNLSVSQAPSGLRVLDLFAGCGGMSLGFEAAGFHVTGYEMNADACSTYRANLSGQCHCETLTTESTFPEADIVIGGPPCQPFSVVGQQQGREDRRNGLEVFVHAVQSVQPNLWMFENVKGLLGRSRDYVQDVLDRLRGLGYKVEEPEIVNAQYYGVPQSRERVVVVGHKLPAFNWPSQEETEYTVGSAIGRTVSRAFTDSRFLTPAMDRYIAKYEKASGCKRPRDLRLDAPSRTLTCRNLGGATGDMVRLRLPDGRRRLLTVSEAARLQSFPSWFKFKGSFASKMSQIGNAVPPMLALRLAQALTENLESARPHSKRRR